MSSNEWALVSPMSVVFSVIFDGIGKKAHIWDEIARAKGARPEWDYYISRYRQQRAMSVQWKIIVKCPHCSAVKVFVWIKIWYSLAKRNVIYTILNSENVNEVSQVTLGVPHGSLGHQKEIANLILGKLALETWLMWRKFDVNCRLSIDIVSIWTNIKWEISYHF